MVGKRILYVNGIDDLDIYQVELQSIGFDTSLERSLPQALERLMGLAPYDLIVLNLCGLPHVNNYPGLKKEDFNHSPAFYFYDQLRKPDCFHSRTPTFLLHLCRTERMQEKLRPIIEQDGSLVEVVYIMPVMPGEFEERVQRRLA